MKYAKKSLQNWMNTPFEGEGVEQLYIRFCRAFRHTHWRNEAIARLEWDEFYQFPPGDDSILDHPLVVREEKLLVPCPKALYTVPLRELRPFPPDWKNADIHFVPTSFAWCLGHTHDGNFCLKDVTGTFTDLGKPFSWTEYLKEYNAKGMTDPPG